MVPTDTIPSRCQSHLIHCQQADTCVGCASTHPARLDPTGYAPACICQHGRTGGSEHRLSCCYDMCRYPETASFLHLYHPRFPTAGAPFNGGMETWSDRDAPNRSSVGQTNQQRRRNSSSFLKVPHGCELRELVITMVTLWTEQQQQG